MGPKVFIHDTIYTHTHARTHSMHALWSMRFCQMTLEAHMHTRAHCPKYLETVFGSGGHVDVGSSACVYVCVCVFACALTFWLGAACHC